MGRWYNRLLLSYLPIFLGAMIILTLIFFMAAAQLTKQEALRANQRFAEQVMQSVDYSLRVVDQAAISVIRTDATVRAFFASDPGHNPYLLNDETSRKLKELMENNLAIDSVYLHRYADDTVLTPEIMSPLSRFYDASFLKRIRERPADVFHWSEPRQIQEFYRQHEYVVSLVRGAPLFSGKHGVLVVNVRTSSLLDLMKDMTKTQYSFAALVDANGTYLAGTEPIAFANREEFERYHDNEELSEIVSDYTGYTLISGMKWGGLLQVLGTLSVVWIALGIVVFALGVGSMVFISRKNYRPIELILQRIGTYLPREPRGDGETENAPRAGKADEFAIIESSLEVLMQRSVSYRKENEENLAYKRNHLFREWIEGQRDVDDEEWRSHLAQLRIADPAPPYAVALLEIDQYPTFVSRYGQRDQELFKFVLGNVFAETAKTSSLHVWSEWIAPQRLGVVVLPGEAPAQRELHAVCRSVVAWVADNLSFTVTIGIGSTVGSPNEIYMSYSEAREALEYKSVLGGNQAIRSNDTTMQAGEVYKLLPPVRTLSQQFRIGDAAWRGQAEQLFREMQSNLFTRADLSGLASFILYHLHREVADLPDEFQRVWNEETMPRLAGAIERFETVVDLEQGFMAALDDAEAAFAGLRRHRSGHTQMQQVKRYIEDNYANPDMSLSLVGDAFRMRQSNLSRMFKEEFGENFVDYLARLRIERAIEKMRTQAETMQDIAASVGYPHYISFNRVFKKVTGIAPADYRNKLAREGKPE